ncbi:MAG: 2-amino-4-hydroxy-6-hydroxymethyldihydropteridine diphosphokinase [Terracidiphilus sp.]
MARCDTLEHMRMAYIGLGGNLASWAGEPEATLTAAATRLQSLGRMMARSSLYSTAPVGYAAQPRFVNAVVAIATELEPCDLLDSLLSIEREFGRERKTGLRNGPRTLDLDILLWDNQRIRESGLEIPHPRLTERAFVLAPLSEIAPSLVVPGHAETVAQQVDRLRWDARAGGAVVRIESKQWQTSIPASTRLPGWRPG